ncbi:response regulator [Robertkochia flava]|uniref:response regulator n=1 Tax=Robertkochia flava TaxID=3447986 RepID=UPI001CC9A86E|nr:response regulator [Robertkochia marina]
MIKKVLIAEDIDSINEGLVNFLSDTFNFEIVQAKYCDEAYLKIKRAILDEEPFDLLITDLSFKQDHRDANLKDGEMLMNRLRDEAIDIKAIMYSIEDRPFRVRQLIDKLRLSAFVTKGRNSINDLKQVIQAISKGEAIPVAPQRDQLPGEESMNLDDYDIALLSKLSEGLSQEEIGQLFKDNNIKPASLSSIEKRINKLKIYLKAKNTIHLIAIAKDMGII